MRQTSTHFCDIYKYSCMGKGHKFIHILFSTHLLFSSAQKDYSIILFCGIECVNVTKLSEWHCRPHAIYLLLPNSSFTTYSTYSKYHIQFRYPPEIGSHGTLVLMVFSFLWYKYVYTYISGMENTLNIMYHNCFDPGPSVSFFVIISKNIIYFINLRSWYLGVIKPVMHIFCAAQPCRSVWLC
jgi:hypothetical protein